MDTMLTYNTNSNTGPVCGRRAVLWKTTKDFVTKRQNKTENV